jgi:hypothetical protein
MNFIDSLISNLAYTIVCSIISPKIYLLLLINLKIIGQEINLDLKSFIGEYKQLLSDLIRSIRDELISFYVNKLRVIIQDLVKELANKIAIEQAMYYARLLQRILYNLKKFKNKVEMDFNIDEIDYADILTEETEEPKNNDC